MDTTLINLVRAAQAGDLEAFGALVPRFQAMAQAVAYTIVGDAHLAQDAAQEAFIAAYLGLAGLRDPAAFPGWFRRIVVKCADRLVRGKSHTTVPIDVAGALASAAPGPAELAEARELGQCVQSAVGALPDHERQVVLLRYMAGYPHSQIAALLELPLTTVKKRLFSARHRMRPQLDGLLRDQLGEPAGPQFARLVQFFIAVRLGDLARVRAQLDAEPALLAAQERWDEATARQFGLPVLVSAFTALHRAVYNGHTALAELLLARGADADARTHNQRSPLHLAVLIDRPALAELLLTHGASPNSATAQGITPLHCAVILGRAALAARLLAHGADAYAADMHGRTPLDWARLKRNRPVLVALGAAQAITAHRSAGAHKRQVDYTRRLHMNHRSLPPATALLGRVIDAAGNLLVGDVPTSAGPAATAELPAPADATLHASGVKVVDLFAPIVRGGITTATATPGVGLVVLTSQLIHNLATRQGGCAVMATLEDDHMDLQALITDLHGEGVSQHVIVVSGAQSDADTHAQPIADTALALAEELRAGGRETLLVLHSPLLTPATIARLAARRHDGTAALTIVIWQLLTPEQLAANQLPAPPIASDGRLVFSRALAGQNIWPAVDPLRSASRLLDEGLVGAEHLRVAQAARALMAQAGVVAGAGDPAAPLVGRARRALLFQTQPFVVAEPYTALPGEYVAPADAVRGYGAIVDGRHDDLPESALTFVGTIEQALAKATSG